MPVPASAQAQPIATILQSPEGTDHQLYFWCLNNSAR